MNEGVAILAIIPVALPALGSCACDVEEDRFACNAVDPVSPETSAAVVLSLRSAPSGQCHAAQWLASDGQRFSLCHFVSCASP